MRTFAKKKVYTPIVRAVNEFGMIQNGDHILVAFSGGKDSWVLLYMLQELKKRLPITFHFSAFHIMTGEYENQLAPLEDFCRINQIQLDIVAKSIEDLSNKFMRAGSSYCSFCARIKRGTIYGFAREKGITKIALGHHREDLLETLLLNLFFAGQIKSMSPIYRTNDQQFNVIRPMVYVAEKDIKIYARKKNIPVLQYSCPHIVLKDGGQRQKMKQMLADMEKQNPQVKANLLHALQNVTASHLLDRDLFSFPPK